MLISRYSKFGVRACALMNQGLLVCERQLTCGKKRGILNKQIKANASAVSRIAVVLNSNHTLQVHYVQYIIVIIATEEAPANQQRLVKPCLCVYTIPLGRYRGRFENEYRHNTEWARETKRDADQFQNLIIHKTLCKLRSIYLKTQCK